MNTHNDFLFALQLQNELNGIESVNTDNSDRPVTCVDLTDITDSNSAVNSDVSVDLTDRLVEVKRKKYDQMSQQNRPIKRMCHVDSAESVIDLSWETLDPNPDIHGLFLTFNRHYFWSALDSVTIQWSKRMTVCAGLCKYQNGFCSISLSEPLLKLRPRKDLVETLLHEMIHAYLFLTNNKDHRDRDGHGPEFCKHMYRINIEAGTKISIYHDFHEEVRLYKQHWWKCNGPCQKTKPFYGYVKRSMNRAPGPNDRWWANHQATCHGNFIKIKEPEGYRSKNKPIVSSVPSKSVKPLNKITNFIKILDSPTKKVFDESVKIISKESDQQKVEEDLCLDEMTICPVCNDSIYADWLNIHLENCSQLQEMFDKEIGDKCKCPACNDTIDRSLMNDHLDSCKILSCVFENKDSISISDDSNYVNCPNCDKLINDVAINEHLDICLSVGSNKLDVQNILKCPNCEIKFKSVIELDDHIDACLIESK